MKINRLTFFSALLMTIAITIIVMAFDYGSKLEKGSINITSLYIISIFLIFVITYIGIETLFTYYGKKQIRKMADRLPDTILTESDNFSFKEFSEKIADFSQKTDSEMDMMKEMEDFRKEYIGNVSHELKTPLFSIQGYVETLRDGAAENNTIRDKYLERIGISVERLINIVNDLDMIIRLEADESTLIPKLFGRRIARGKGRHEPCLREPFGACLTDHAKVNDNHLTV